MLPGWRVVAQLLSLLSVLLQDIYREPELCPALRCPALLLLSTSTPCRGVSYRGSFLRGLEQVPPLLPVAWRKAGLALLPLPNVPLM